MAAIVPLLDNNIRMAWYAAAAQGHPPDPRLVAELQYGLVIHWVHKEILDVVQRLNPANATKTFFCIESSRGVGKTTLANFLRLYAIEYCLPFLQRPGLPIRPENLRWIIFGRDQNHIRDEILPPIKEMVVNHAPWLRTPDWAGIIGDPDEPDPEGLREIADKKSSGPQKWESFRLDFANGTSIRTRTLKQSVRSVHVFAGDMDDILTEQNVDQSPHIKSLLRAAIRPAIEPGGIFLCLGTPQVPGDFFDLCKDDPDIIYRAFPALDDGTSAIPYTERNRAWLGEKAYGSLKPEDRQSLWPARLSWAYLEAERGTTVESNNKFDREYLLKRILAETALVHPDYITLAKDRNLSYHTRAEPGFTYRGGVDPSQLKKDEAGFCVGYVRPDGCKIPATFSKLLANPRLPLGKAEESIVQELNSLARLYDCYDWLVESNGLQSAIVPLAKHLNASIRFEGFALTSNKHTENGWAGLRTLFRSQRVKLPYATEEDRLLTDQFLFQLTGLQYIEGKVIEDPKRKNDLVSAFFLFLKAVETTAPEYSFTAVSSSSGGTADAVRLPGAPTPAPFRPHGAPRGELNRDTSGPSSAPTIASRLARIRRWS